MIRLNLRQNRAGHWDVFADGLQHPTSTFTTVDDALEFATDLAAIRTGQLRITVDYGYPERGLDGFFHTQAKRA